MRFFLYILYLKSLFIFIIIGRIIPGVFSQSGVINFSTLGSVDYKEKIFQLEKYTVPKKYSDKSSQAWYDEILTDRNKRLLASFKDDKLINDSLLLNKFKSILKKIAAANKYHSFDSIILYIAFFNPAITMFQQLVNNFMGYH